MIDFGLHDTLHFVPIGPERVRPSAAIAFNGDIAIQVSWSMRQGRRSRGIIIKKHFPHRQRISLIDASEGRLEVIPSSWQWASYAGAGSLISYRLNTRADAHVMDEVQLLQMPSYIDESTHLFMQHILELCYFCVPVSSGPTRCFDVLQQLVGMLPEIAGKAVLQKLIVARLLAYTGQESPEAHALPVAALIERCRNARSIPALDEGVERELERYIYYCLRTHPYSHLFKTVTFLSEVRKP